MPKVIGGHDPAIKKCWNDTYTSDPITIAGLTAVLKASRQKQKGWNGAAVEQRIKYLRTAMNIGLVEDDSMRRAQKTIAHLESQLCPK